MLPAIGSVTTLASQGKAGVVVGARPIGEAEGGRQLVALRIKTGGTGAESKHGTALAVPADKAGQQNGSGRSALPADRLSIATPSPPVSAKLPEQLSAAEKADLTRLQQRDQQVRQEEKAHAAVAGDLAGPITYSFQQGPDGRQYAVGGSVGIRATTVSGDPDEAKRLGGRMAAAANAATNPSAQDYATARQAYAFGSQLSLPAATAERKPEISLTL